VVSLRTGDLLPEMRVTPPGPRARELCRQLAEFEAPGINTLSFADSAPLWHEAYGANVVDVDGNRYIDLTAGFGVAAVGHRHPGVVAAVRQQAETLVHGLADVHAHLPRVELARRLAYLAPVDEAQIYFAVSGSDAVEVAFKTCQRATGKPGILAFDPAYHGLTLGALQATSRTEFRRPFEAHFHAWVHRLSYGCEPAEIAELLAAEGQIGCVVVEPVVGREGVLPPPPGWLTAVADICRRYQAVFVADEIFTGFGRTGEWFAVDSEGVRPDLLCCGKALGGGLPIAAVAGRRELMAAWAGQHEALHTATFVAHPLACASALAVLEILETDDLPRRAAALGETIRRRSAEWPSRYPAVLEVRGRGLLWGIELASDTLAKALAQRLLECGLLILAGGPGGRVLQLVPPLTIGESQLSFVLDAIESELAED
jgi:4-aminobutyrate aminotransferase-like enzyme